MSEREWPEIVVMGYSEAGMFLRGGGAGRVGAVLSIHGGREFGVEWDRGPRLDLGFDDVEVPEAGDVVAVLQAGVRRRWEEEHGLVQRGPTVEDARAIVEFARGIGEKGGRTGGGEVRGGTSGSPRKGKPDREPDCRGAGRDAASVVGSPSANRGVVPGRFVKGKVLLCHCGGGVSRGPAAAILCLATWRGEVAGG